MIAAGSEVFITDGPLRGRLARVVQVPAGAGDGGADDNDDEEGIDEEEEYWNGSSDDDGEQMVWAEADLLRPLPNAAFARQRWRAVWVMAVLVLALAAFEGMVADMEMCSM